MSSKIAALIGISKNTFDKELLEKELSKLEIIFGDAKNIFNDSYFLVKFGGVEIEIRLFDFTKERTIAYLDSYQKPHYWRQDLIFLLFRTDFFVVKTKESYEKFVEFVKNSIKNIQREFILFDEYETLEQHMLEENMEMFKLKN